jgi:hypothetical protein
MMHEWVEQRKIIVYIEAERVYGDMMGLLVHQQAIFWSTLWIASSWDWSKLPRRSIVSSIQPKGILARVAHIQEIVLVPHGE